MPARSTAPSTHQSGGSGHQAVFIHRVNPWQKVPAPTLPVHGPQVLHAAAVPLAPCLAIADQPGLRRQTSCRSPMWTRHRLGPGCCSPMPCWRCTWCRCQMGPRARSSTSLVCPVILDERVGGGLPESSHAEVSQEGFQRSSWRPHLHGVLWACARTSGIRNCSLLGRGTRGRYARVGESVSANSHPGSVGIA